MLTVGCATWNNVDFIKGFLESTKVIEYPFELAIWNNGSVDGTKEYLDSYMPTNNYCRAIHIEHSPENTGMVIPWNWILQKCLDTPDSENAWVCNDDIRFTKTINRIIPFCQENPLYGLVCPAMLPRDVDLNDLDDVAEQYTQENGNRLEVNGLEGPHLCIPKEVINIVGMFDPNLKNSFNDMDYHQRVIKAGLIPVVYHNAAVWHHGGASTSKNPDVHNKYYYEEFQRKHG